MPRAATAARVDRDRAQSIERGLRDARSTGDLSPLIHGADSTMRSAAAPIVRRDFVIDDVVQEAWLRVLPHRKTLLSLHAAAAVAYLRRATRGAALDHLRAQGTQKRLPAGGFEYLDAADAPALVDPRPRQDEVHEAREAIGGALGAAESADRALVAAVIVDGFTQREAAAIFGLSPQAVGRRVARFRNLWRKRT